MTSENATTSTPLSERNTTILSEWNSAIPSFDGKAAAAARAKWNAVAKPIYSLGQLEHVLVQIAGLRATSDVRIDRRIALVMCADNGVVAQGVSQCGSEVTRTVAESIARGTSSVCTMSKPHRIDTQAVDVGMIEPSSEDKILDYSVARGSADITQGPAMSCEQAIEALCTGVNLARMYAKTYDILIAGEMGIGNTTCASALTAALLGLPVSSVVGRGAGLDDAGLSRKVDAIERALEVNKPNPSRPLEVLASVGSFDIAAMAGLYIGGALSGRPVVVDGLTSSAAAYLAQLLVPRCSLALVASHVSREPAAQILREHIAFQFDAACQQAHVSDLGLQYVPVIDAGMFLGEATGGVCLIPLLDSALALYKGATFDDYRMTPYDPDLQVKR